MNPSPSFCKLPVMKTELCATPLKRLAAESCIAIAKAGNSAARGRSPGPSDDAREEFDSRSQIAGPPAHHAVDRRDRALVYDPAEKGFVHVVELGRCARRRDVQFGNPQKSPNRSVGIIRSRVQLEKIAETLVPQMAQKAREIGISANGVRAQNRRAGRLNQVDPPLASITSSSVRNPVRGALTSTAMLPGGCRLVRINSCACGILVQGNTSLMQGSMRRSSTN